jgi:two-component system cell cycle sensor histidine kinase/response regulator CckA
LRVLVVEDNRGTRNALDLWLARLGVDSILCRDAEEGLQRLTEMQRRGDQVEMILTDYLLPGQSGLDLIQKCRSHLPNLKAVLFSGYLDEKLRQKAQELSNCRFLAKPFTSEDLHRIFRELEQADAT